MNYSILIPSHNFALAEKVKECLQGMSVKIFDGRNYPSYAKLINDCIITAENEIVIIINHKLRPNAMHIYKMLNLIHQGYGLVCMRNFYFYGFKKDLIRKVGFFDERFVGGGCEDADFIRRLIENNIGWYDSTETPLVVLPTSWDQSKSYNFFYKKWKDGKLERLLPDEKYDYNIGSFQGSTFLDLTHTVLSKTNEDYFNSINFKFK